MGKLHKIRKAVEANPERFMRGPTAWPERIKGRYHAIRAGVDPSGNVKTYFRGMHYHSHEYYVAKVLNDLGHNVLNPSWWRSS